MLPISYDVAISGRTHAPRFWSLGKTKPIIRLDKQYLEWLKTRRSAHSGKSREYHDGEGFSIPCRVRRAWNAGTGMNSLFSALRLTDAEHKLTRQHRETAR